MARSGASLTLIIRSPRNNRFILEQRILPSMTLLKFGIGHAVRRKEDDALLRGAAVSLPARYTRLSCGRRMRMRAFA